MLRRDEIVLVRVAGALASVSLLDFFLVASTLARRASIKSTIFSPLVDGVAGKGAPATLASMTLGVLEARHDLVPGDRLFVFRAPADVL